MVRHGIVQRKQDEDEAKQFEYTNIMEWVIHHVIHWLDDINMEKYSKYFATFSKPISGIKLLNYKEIYSFRLHVDYQIECDDAMKIMKEIDKLRKYKPRDPNLIDYEETGKWLQLSFKLLAEQYR